MQRTIRMFFVAALTATGLAASVGRAHSATAAPIVAASPPLPTQAEPAIATPGPVGDYLRAVHARMHARWTQEFVKTVAATYPPSHPLNDQSRKTTIALAIRWDGTVAEAAVKKPSGSPEFDRAALGIARKSAPFPLPVADAISDDSYAHLDWTFARDTRACAAGAEVVRVDDPLEISLPRLIANNRVAEALRRVGQASTDGSGGSLDRFARLFLGRTVPDPLLNVAAAVALAESGDQSQAGRLRAALASRPTAELAARGLRKLGIDICDAVRETLETGTPLARETALGATRSAALAGADLSACRPSLAQLVADGRQPTPLRLQALDTLVTFIPAAARPVVMAAIEDKEPAVRGAALLASVRKGAGRPEMYRLAPLLHDKTLEVRGAASAGMVRAGGDLALDQLYLLGRETDPRPGTWVAAELGQMASRASAEFLGKMLKKDNLPVQVAAARALAARKDAPARAELDAVKSDDRAPREVRAIAAGDAAAPAVVASSAAVPPTRAAIEPVRQFLKNNHNREAAGWIVERLPSLEPLDAIDVLGAWLLRRPATAAVEAPAARANPVTPSEAAPTAANSPTL